MPVRRFGGYWSARVDSVNEPTDNSQDGTLQWRWEDLTWRNRVGDNPQWIAREALRRAVDIRDTNVIDARSLSARPVFLVDVLNRLCEVLNVETDHLWGQV